MGKRDKRMAPEQLILQKLEKIEKEIKVIKEHVVDADAVLSKEEKQMLDESIKHEKEGRLVSLDDIEMWSMKITNTALASEKALAKDWLSPEEDRAWKDL